MSIRLSFDNLNSTEFEEFCFDLLKELQFVNLNWRKGTAYSTSPSDSGRDIECERTVLDIDDTTYHEKWFVECKHQKKGISSKEIQGILAWANAKRPNKVLVIASGFLSNPCKDYIQEYTDNNRPPFMIKYWESKNLEELTPLALLEKYHLASETDIAKLASAKVHEGDLHPPPIPRISCELVAVASSDPFHLYFYLINHDTSLTARVLVDAMIFLDGEELGYPVRDTGHYSGTKEWNMNPGMIFRGHFRVPQEAVESNARLSIVVRLKATDRHSRTQELLPFKWIYNRDRGYWFPEP